MVKLHQIQQEETNVKLEKDKQSMHHTNGVGLPSVNTLNNSWCVVMKSQAPLEASLMSRGEERWRLPHSQRNINWLLQLLLSADHTSLHHAQSYYRETDLLVHLCGLKSGLFALYCTSSDLEKETWELQ